MAPKLRRRYGPAPIAVMGQVNAPSAATAVARNTGSISCVGYNASCRLTLTLCRTRAADHETART
jgi:hypothetical protein